MAVYCQTHSEAVFGVIFKEAVCPGGAFTVLVFGVGHGGECAAPNGGTASGIGDNHAIAKELSEQLDIRGFTATGTSSGEFKQGLLKLASLHCGFLEGAQHVVGQLFEVFIIRLFAGFAFVLDRAHHEGLFWAFVHANAAALTVVDINLDLVLIAFGTHGFQGLEGAGGSLQIFFFDQLGTDRGVGAHEGALVALDAVFRDPFWNGGGHLAFFQLGSSAFHIAIQRHLGNLDHIALLAHDGLDHVFHKTGGSFRYQLLCGTAFTRQGGGNVHFHQGFIHFIHGI
ncbi:hypothetical protein DSECCO2_538750 [anaerobic digester metagenome]